MLDFRDERLQFEIIGKEIRVVHLHAHLDGVHIVDAVDDDLIRFAQFVHAHEHALDLRREHVDAADDEHVVRPADHARHARERPAALARLVCERSDVLGAVAQDGHPLLGERGDEHFALLALVEDFIMLDVDDFGVEHILVDVHARLFAAFARDARAAHFGQPIVFRGEGTQNLLQGFVHLRRGGFRAHADEADFQIVQNAHLLRRFGEVHGIAGRGDERRRAEVLQEHDLPLGVARGDGNDRRTQLLHAVMQTESARKQTVAERDVEDVLVRRPRHHENARDAGRPIVQILAGIAADDGLARRARRGVQADNLLHRHGKKTERIMVSQIVLGRVRNIFDVFERPDMLGSESDLIEPLLIHGHALVRVRDDML